jgi:hypothetical protein
LGPFGRGIHFQPYNIIYKTNIKKSKILNIHPKKQKKKNKNVYKIALKQNEKMNIFWFKSDKKEKNQIVFLKSKN